MEGERILSNLPFFAYLKIAEGCDNRCTYCAIPMIRGRYRSREIDKIVAEAKLLADHGVTELNVVAQDTTRYGVDLYGKPMLPELLRRLAQIEGLRWIRVLYTYPDWITDELLDVMAREEKIVKYLDIPLQHCNKKVLQEMNRRGDRESLTALMRKIREKVPGIVLRTTLITGFPVKRRSSLRNCASLCRRSDLSGWAVSPTRRRRGRLRESGPIRSIPRCGSAGRTSLWNCRWGLWKNITRGWSDPI